MKSLVLVLLLGFADSASSEPLKDPVCTANQLRIPELKKTISFPFEIKQIDCTARFAKAKIVPSKAEDRKAVDDSIAIYQRIAKRWQLIDIGTGISCPLPPLPNSLCNRWLNSH